MTRDTSAAGSFTQRVLTELAPHIPQLACCRTAFVLGLLAVSEDGDVLTTTRLVAARTALQVLHAQGQNAAYVVRIAAARRRRYAVWGCDLEALPARTTASHCARSFLRGAVLGAGRIARPESVPHIEIACPRDVDAAAVSAELVAFGIPAVLRTHRGRPLITVRSAAGVGEVLSVVGAQAGRLAFEGGRVVHEIRGGLNRSINAETANLRRAAAASVVQQTAAEQVSRDTTLWGRLPPALREAAMLRQEHPGLDLAALARHAGCSRSAMAGRLHRLVDASQRAAPVVV
ncbi:MAG: DNA-binding protein WhiA [Candidatus Dormibacteraeota bacterium]|nr:DNA-binding protein WhiA [Candidatus Dormibacteraeota bacterium]